jgi:DNA-binding MarR family transcriptional regulator
VGSGGDGDEVKPYPDCARIARVLERLKDVHPEMSVRQALALLWIAAHPGVKQHELRGLLSPGGRPAADGMISRVLAILSEVGAGGITGLALVDMTLNRNDRREKLLTLSPKGRRLIEGCLRDLRGQ